MNLKKSLSNSENAEGPNEEPSQLIVQLSKE